MTEILRGVNVPGGQLRRADLVTWEARYEGGALHAESLGHPYAAIDRARLVSFALVDFQGDLVDLHVPLGEDGRRLVYRRRTAVGAMGRTVIFLVGWAGGLLMAVAPDAGQARVSETGWVVGDTDFEPVPAHPAEGEHW